MLRSIGPLELGIILLIVIIIFGAGRIGNIGKEFGEAIGLFKKGLKDAEKEDQDQTTPSEDSSQE